MNANELRSDMRERGLQYVTRVDILDERHRVQAGGIDRPVLSIRERRQNSFDHRVTIATSAVSVRYGG